MSLLSPMIAAAAAKEVGAVTILTVALISLIAGMGVVIGIRAIIHWLNSGSRIKHVEQLAATDDYPVRRDPLADYVSAWDGIVVNAEFERIADRIADDLHWDSVRDTLDGDDAA